MRGSSIGSGKLMQACWYTLPVPIVITTTATTTPVTTTQIQTHCRLVTLHVRMVSMYVYREIWENIFYMFGLCTSPCTPTFPLFYMVPSPCERVLIFRSLLTGWHYLRLYIIKENCKLLPRRSVYHQGELLNIKGSFVPLIREIQVSQIWCIE